MRFTTEGLGMVQTDWLQTEIADGIELEVHFLHCNARHHTLALARAPFELPQHLHHVMFETNDRDDVGRAFDRAFAARLPIPNGLGVYDNDRTFSFYLASPAGFQVEVGHRAAPGLRTLDRRPPLRTDQRIGPPARHARPDEVTTIKTTEVAQDLRDGGYGGLISRRGSHHRDPRQAPLSGQTVLNASTIPARMASGIVSIGLVPHFEDLTGSAARRRAAVDAAVRAGVDHLGVVDHVSFGTGWGMDGLVQASALLALDHDLPVHVGAYLLALRSPLVVARQLADLAAAAPGRISLAVGVGGEDRREIANAGVDPATRGQRTDECLAAVRSLLTGEPVTTEGNHVWLDGALVRPVPDPPIPMTVAGRSAAAIRRAGELGDGWFGLWASPRRFAEATAEVDKIGEAAGRDRRTWNHGLAVWCGIGGDHHAGQAALAPTLAAIYRIEPERVMKWCPCGPPSEIADALRPYIAAGCSSFNLMARASTTGEAAEAVGEIRSLLRTR